MIRFGGEREVERSESNRRRGKQHPRSISNAYGVTVDLLNYVGRFIEICEKRFLAP